MPTVGQKKKKKKTTQPIGSVKKKGIFFPARVKTRAGSGALPHHPRDTIPSPPPYIRTAASNQRSPCGVALRHSREYADREASKNEPTEEAIVSFCRTL
jgi:hypothetical protein